MPTLTIIHPRLHVTTIIDIHDVPKNVLTVHKEKSISGNPICLPDSDWDYILEEIDHEDNIVFEIDIEVLSGGK